MFSSLSHYRSRKSSPKSEREKEKEKADFEDFEGQHYVPRELRSRSYKEHLLGIEMHVSSVSIQGGEREMQGRNGGKGTGFPEPFCEDRNTTLPHPSADTSPNATIEAEDIPAIRTYSRHRSFLGRNYPKSKINAGRLNLQESGLYNNIQYVDGSPEQKSAVETVKTHKKRDSGVHTGASQESLASLPEVPEAKERDGQAYEEGGRKKGVLRKPKSPKYE